MNYINLDLEFSDFIKPCLNLKEIKFPKFIAHDWIWVNTVDWITEFGIEWFKNKNIPIKSRAFLFVATPNCPGITHIDLPERAAFNFIIQGNGSMQWLSNLSDPTSVRVHNGSTYPVYGNTKSCIIDDEWTGRIGLVKVDTPHRVVTTDSYRYCLSLRTTYSFEEVAKIIQSSHH